ncbi:MAG: molybdopterin-dependent oxidoreductase [Vulcanimicrobiaceae bacterium]
MKRRLFLISTTVAMTGCAHETYVLNNAAWLRGIVDSTEQLNQAIIGTRGFAKLYEERDVSAVFPIDSLPTPQSGRYRQYMRDDFRSYRLSVRGEVEDPGDLSLQHLRAMRQHTQITRHDCVEGWSAIGKWSGIALRDLLALVRPKREARFIVFHCMDADQSGAPYYESLDLDQAMHPQTLLALDFNGRRLPVEHGAPVRLRIPTQLGYKGAKWVRRIELVTSYAHVYGGKGGYYEDNGYEWFAGM